jgi:hypothetical protein
MRKWLRMVKNKETIFVYCFKVDSKKDDEAAKFHYLVGRN